MILHYILIIVTEIFYRSHMGGINADIFFADKENIIYSKSDHFKIVFNIIIRPDFFQKISSSIISVKL